jgi:hypothetical protein
LLGNEEAAIAGARRAVELLPVSSDALRGLDAVSNLARVYAILGHDEDAIEQLEYLLSVVSFWTAADFRRDPLFAPFRDNSRFQAMLRVYEN